MNALLGLSALMSRCLHRRPFISTSVRIAAGLFLLGVFGWSAAPAVESTGFATISRASSLYGVVASASEQASRVGIDVLNRDGTAVEAAIATVFAVGVTRPDLNGIGGGGFLVHRSATGKIAALDFREFAPLAIAPTSFQATGDTQMHRDGFGGSGHLVVGVPGTVAGMAEALRVLGTGQFTLDQLISSEADKRAVPYAYELARDGVVVTFELAANFFFTQSRISYYPETARIYGAIDALYFAKQKLKQEDYAKSPALIADYGPEAFYQNLIYPEGESIARRIASSMANAQSASKTNPALIARFGPGADRGVMTLDDLASYRAVWRKPLVGSYRGHEIIAMPPPTSGGLATIEILNIIEGFPLGSNALDTAKPLNADTSWAKSSANQIHVLAEAQKIAWADRNFYVGDPDFVKMPIAQLTNKGYAEQRRHEIGADPTLFQAKADYAPASGHRSSSGTSATAAGVHTTHVSVLDRYGNAATITNTINGLFGSVVVAPGTGFLLNNQLTDFNIDQPGTANEANGRKRPRSCMSPTIVLRGSRPFLATGGAGGSAIPMGVVHNVMHMVDFGLDLAHAVDAERIDARVLLSAGESSTRLRVERGTGATPRVSQAVWDELIAREHQPEDPGFEGADFAGDPVIEAVAPNPFTGLNEAVSDMRHFRNFQGEDEERGAAGQ